MQYFQGIARKVKLFTLYMHILYYVYIASQAYETELHINIIMYMYRLPWQLSC